MSSGNNITFSNIKQPPQYRRAIFISEAAEIAGVTPKTIWNWGKNGHIKIHHAVGRRARIDREELERYLLG